MVPETPSKLSAEAAQKSRNEHRRAVLREARDVAGLQRQTLLCDADLCEAAFDCDLGSRRGTGEQIGERLTLRLVCG